MQLIPNESEQWKIISDFPQYAVSNYGRVKRVIGIKGQAAGKIISQRLHPNIKYSKCNYPSVRFNINGKTFTRLVHIFVLTAFAGDRPAGMVANHKDGNKENNHIANLEWTTQSENIKHAFRLKLKENKKGVKNPQSKLSYSEAYFVKKLLKDGHLTQKQIGDIFDVHHSTISLIKKRKRYAEVNCEIPYI